VAAFFVGKSPVAVPHHRGMDYTLHHGDCLEVMAGMEAGSVDAVVTDPPYGLGFMGKQWDSLPPGPETASAMLRVLRPSSYLLAFGGTRTWHRLACALEDAGFEIRDTLMWLYGSGFPKAKSCLKPAWEPVILARKPGPMRELGIEECRVGVRDESKMYVQPRATTDAGGASWSKGEHVPFHYGESGGRWPANVVLDEAAAAMVDEQTGTLTSGSMKPTLSGMGYGGGNGSIRETHGDSGGASRFFYCAKASRSERNEGLDGLPLRGRNEVYGDGMSTATKCDPRMGHTQESVQARPQVANHHPTVKPVALMRWLVRLVAQPGDVVLDPFTGSGTTGVACANEGRDFIGIEREAEYVEIARRRIEAAAAQLTLL
jgi:DNA modification methylase